VKCGPVLDDGPRKPNSWLCEGESNEDKTGSLLRNVVLELKLHQAPKSQREFLESVLPKCVVRVPPRWHGKWFQGLHLRKEITKIVPGFYLLSYEL